MAERLYIARQDEANGVWHTIARLTRDNGGYELLFTQGAKRLGDLPEPLSKMQLKYRYRFETLINLFRNRIPSRSRPDFGKMARWLNLRGSEDEFALLSRFGQIPGSDALLLYPEPKIVAGNYDIVFFVHGIRHALKWREDVEPYARVFPVFDIQNPVDPRAIALRSDTNILVGFVPTFYAADLRRILLNEALCAAARVTILRNNKDAPIQMRLLCRFVSPVPPGFRPLDSISHKPVLELEAETV